MTEAVGSRWEGMTRKRHRRTVIEFREDSFLVHTMEPFRSFVLTFDWRWAPGKKAGSGGVLSRMTGAPKIWPKSLEAQINAGDAGDFWGLDGYEDSQPRADFPGGCGPGTTSGKSDRDRPTLPADPHRDPATSGLRPRGARPAAW